MPTLSKKGRPLYSNSATPVGPDELQLPDPKISLDQCVHALGVYLFDWDRLNVAFEAVTQALFGMDDLRAHIVVESVQQNTLRNLLRDVGSNYLDASQFAELSALLLEAQNLAGTRNKLVHGRWSIQVKLLEGTSTVLSAEWARVYSVTDKETHHIMMDAKHQKSRNLREKNIFFPDAIHAEALKIQPVADRLLKLAGELRVSRDHPPEPRSRRGRAARKAKGKRGR